MPKNFYDEFNRDPATYQEYIDIAWGLNVAGSVAVTVMILSLIILMAV